MYERATGLLVCWSVVCWHAAFVDFVAFVAFVALLCVAFVAFVARCVCCGAELDYSRC